MVFPIKKSRSDEVVAIAAFTLLHIPLALLMDASPTIATLHALATLGLGILFLTEPTPRRVIFTSAYITGADVLWRVTGAGVFYEFGKYSLILLLGLAMFRYGRLGRASKLPLLFFILLLPSLLELPYFNREDISFNLSGPLTLAVSTMFYSTVKFKIEGVKKVLILVTAPVTGLAFLATYSTITAQEIEFTGESLKATSAGFGPNQVATILGLGALCALYYAIIENRQRSLRFFLVLLSIWFLTQSLLTFSRGGIWAAVGALMVGLYFLLRLSRSRLSIMFPVLFIFIIGYTLIWPVLQDFTGGLIQQRYTDFEPTGRTEILQSDLETFQDNPHFGVGPGQSYYYHDLYFRESEAHTEYTRLLAEHGAFGLSAILILIYFSLKRFFSKDSLRQKSFSGAFTTWSLLTLLHSAMRLAAPGFIFGIAGASILDDETKRSEDVLETHSKFSKWRNPPS
jgi:O-antigen ligase